MNQKKFFNEELNITVTVNKFAQQAHGVLLEKNGTTVLSTLAQESSTDFPGFFPLSVDYREHFSAAGKIPGGYFKREGKSTDREVLSGRLIDRCLRPLFPKNLFDKVCITSTVYSIDPIALPISLSLLGASLSANLSSINMVDLAGCCNLVVIDNKWVVYPTLEQYNNSINHLIVTGTIDGINMVEGVFDGINEEFLVEGLFIAYEEIKKQVEWQKIIINELNIIKKPFVDVFNIDYWTKNITGFLNDAHIKALFCFDKNERNQKREEIWNTFLEQNKNIIEEKKIHYSIIEYSFNAVLQEKITDEMNKKNKRIDDRDFDTIRSISSEVSLLPRTHGSGLFTRGKTQLLVSVTLGSANDEAKIETLLEENHMPFMLHYNFLPFSVGEARGLRAPGRREVGHGHLAANAIRGILPDKNKFPYTIRIVADVLSSDGSTSMATVCGSTLALMDAGVPIKNMVAGIAMGMIEGSNGEFKVLTDIAAFEDEFGLMDLKVAGTKDSITAVQMDIKYKGGLKKSLFEFAFNKAKIARISILENMRNVISEPRKSVSSLVPQFVIFKIPKEKIGAVIGSGGKVIREITDKTKTSINIEDNGIVKIFGNPGKMLDYAVSVVKMIAGEVISGTIYDGIIKKKMEFGYFVELFTGFDGLIHISTIPRDMQNNFLNAYNEGDKIVVVVVDYDSSTGRIRLGIKK